MSSAASLSPSGLDCGRSAKGLMWSRVTTKCAGTLVATAWCAVACSGDEHAATGSRAPDAGARDAGRDAASHDAGGAADGSGGSVGTGGSGGAGTGGTGTGGLDGGGGGREDAGDSGAALPNGGVLQHHNHANRDGAYVDAAFSRASAASLHLDPTFQATVAGPTYAQPLYFDEGAGGRDLVVVATEQNQVSALDATDGSVVWQRVLAPPVPLTSLACGNIDPVGITGTPIIDAESKTLFLDAMTLAAGGVPKHELHALSLADGSSRPGYPVDMDATVRAGSFVFSSPIQNQRSALALLDGTVYVAYGGHFGDCKPYHGVVAGVNVQNPTQVSAWATRAAKAGSWSPGGIASDGRSLYVTTGNSSGATTWADGEALIRLSPALAFSAAPKDYFTPSNWMMLDAVDNDIGGSGPVLFTAPGATPSELAIALGKDGFAYLLDRAGLGGSDGSTPLAQKSVSVEQIINAATAYTTDLGTYVVFNALGKGCPGGKSGKVTAVQISHAAPPALSVAWCSGPTSGGVRGGSPIVTTVDGKADPIVWWVGAELDNRLYGFDADTGETVFDGGGAAEQMATVQHFQTPIVAKGRMFVASNSAVYAFTPR